MLIGLFVGVRNHNFAVDRAHEYTQLMAERNAMKISSIFEKQLGYVNAFAETQSGELTKIDSKMDSLFKGNIKNQLKKHAEYYSTWTLWKQEFNNLYGNSGSGWLLEEASRKNEGTIKPQINMDGFEMRFGSIVNATTDYISEPYKVDGKFYIEIATPIFHNAEIKGYAGITLGFKVFEDFIKNTPIYEGGFVTLLSNSGMFVGHSNPGFIGHTFKENFPEESKVYPVDTRVGKGDRFEMASRFKRQVYYSYFVPVVVGSCPNPWSIEVTVPMHKILEESKKSIRNSVFVALFGVLLMVLVIWLVSRRITLPIRNVTESLDLLSEGNTNSIDEITIESGDELQKMGESLNKVIEGIRKTESFALEIGKGNLEGEYKLLGKNDQLGQALLSMRGSLKKSREDEAIRKKEEEQRNWSTHGIAKFGDILRQDSNNMKRLGFNVASNLVDYLDVNQGALFVINDENTDDIFYELVTAIAYGRDKFMKREIRVGDGLVGRSIYEKKTIYLTDVPDDYAYITSGLGTANPSCVLIVPCILNDEVFGVIELASFTELKPYQIEFVEKLGESIGSTISSVKINERTSRLLGSSQQQGEELAAQEEELRQNLEEMKATQEDLQRQMAENAEMRRSLTQQNALMDSLLEWLPDYIYFKDINSKFLRVSKSMLKLFDATSMDQVIGKSDFDFKGKEEAQRYFDDEQNIIRNRKGITNQLQREARQNGEIQWNSVTKMPLINKDGEVIGTFGISKDVTPIKEMELEAQEKNAAMEKHLEQMNLAQDDLKQQVKLNEQMKIKLTREKALLDAVLETLPDYVYFKDRESRFIMISKSMLKLFDADSIENVIGKTDFDFAKKEEAQKYYDDEQQIIKSGKGIIDQIQKETRHNGQTVYTSVSKLPLVDSEGNIIGTFGITKDISDFKNLEIQAESRRVELESVLNALKNSSYTVEYDIKGTILEVNEAMLDLFGLKRKQVIGTHHKEGIDLTKKSAGEYKKFWNELLAGKPQREVNKLVIKNKEVWLSETYSPIFDEQGKVFKIMKIAFDITDFVTHKKA